VRRTLDWRARSMGVRIPYAIEQDVFVRLGSAAV
jgi:hypothetical protein